ncbi:YlxR family protein [Meiothermus cerbereus]|uniref:YlxR family protein n=1 Tax=Meiothermus cerbereus TaxID=65552 RepID=UPI003EEACB38
MPKAKHIPIRQCIACRERRPKQELLRIVITEGGPVLDLTGRKPGRGAYVCPDRPGCWAEKKLRRFAGAKATELSLALQMVLGNVFSQTLKVEKPSSQDT